MLKQSGWLNPRLLNILLLGFSSGLPLGLVGSTLQAWFTVSGASLMTIGWLTFVGQPYAFKFLWAPLLDRLSWKKIGCRKTWIIGMQLSLSLTLIIMSYNNPKLSPVFVCLLAFMVAFFSSTQDTAIDAYRTELLENKEQGVGVAINTVAYRIAMMVSTSVALLLAATISWHAMYFLMGITFLILGFFTFYSPVKVTDNQSNLTFSASLIAPTKELLQRENIFWLLIFIVIYKLCDAMALSLNTTFLMRGVGFGLVEIGVVSKVAGLIGSLLGSVVGGILLPRLGLYRALWQFGLFQTLANLGYAWLALSGKNLIGMGIVIFNEYFFGGMATVAFIVLLMRLCDRRYTASQYALFSAVSSLGRIFIGPLAAVIVKAVGWFDFYILTALMGLPALGILYWLNQSRSMVYSVSKP